MSLDLYLPIIVQLAEAADNALVFGSAESHCFHCFNMGGAASGTLCECRIPGSCIIQHDTYNNYLCISNHKTDSVSIFVV